MSLAEHDGGYRLYDDGPRTMTTHDAPGQISVTMTYDAPGCRTRLHVHMFDHWMTCVSGAALIEIDGEQQVVRPGDRYLVERGKRHGVTALASNTVLICEHEIRRENGEIDPSAFSPDGIPVEWLRRLTETWGLVNVAR